MSLINNLEWRYAAKSFDTSKKVSSSDLDTLKKSIQLAATSFGIQLFKVYIVSDQATKEKLLPVSMNQKQITEASHLFVFSVPTKFDNSMAADYIKLVSETRGVPTDSLTQYQEVMDGYIGQMPDDLFQTWLAKQTYIALGNLLAACAELKIDSCPMEGFSPEHYGEILGLGSDYKATVICPVGYRSEDDSYASLKKVRRPFEQLFTEV